MQPTPKRKFPVGLVVAICLFLAAGVVFYLFSFKSGAASRSGAYYLDLNTGKVFIAAAAAFPPIDTPSGPYEGRGAGVRVYIFSCKPCRGFAGMTLDQVKAAGAFPVYLEQYTAEAKKGLDAGDSNPELLMSGLQSRAVDGGKWVDSSSKDAMALRASIKTLCPGGTATPCEP